MRFWTPNRTLLTTRRALTDIPSFVIWCTCQIRIALLLWWIDHFRTVADDCTFLLSSYSVENAYMPACYISAPVGGLLRALHRARRLLRPFCLPRTPFCPAPSFGTPHSTDAHFRLSGADAFSSCSSNCDLFSSLKFAWRIKWLCELMYLDFARLWLLLMYCRPLLKLLSN